MSFSECEVTQLSRALKRATLKECKEDNTVISLSLNQKDMIRYLFYIPVTLPDIFKEIDNSLLQRL